MSPAIGPGQDRRGSLRADAPEGRGVGGVAQPVARLHPRAIRVPEIGDHVRRAGLGGAPGDQAGEAGRDDEAVAGQGLRFGEQAAPWQPAVLALGQVQHGHRPRHPGGTAREHRLGKGHRLAVGLEEQAGRRRHRRRLPPVVGGHRARLRVIEGEEGAAADPGTLRLDQPQRRLHRHGGVHRRAARAEDLEPGFDRQRVGRVDHGAVAMRRRLRAPAEREEQEQQFRKAHGRAFAGRRHPIDLRRRAKRANWTRRRAPCHRLRHEQPSRTPEPDHRRAGPESRPGDGCAGAQRGHGHPAGRAGGLRRGRPGRGAGHAGDRRPGRRRPWSRRWTRSSSPADRSTASPPPTG